MTYRVYTKVLLLILVCAACNLFGQKFNDSQITELKINDKEYLHAPGMSVLAYHNIYPVGMQGFVEIIQYNKRIATNGNVFFEEVAPEDTGPKAHVPIPAIDNPTREIDEANNTIMVPFRYEQLNLNYDLRITGLDNGFKLNIKFLNKIDPSLSPRQKTATHSGKKDDRYVFTNKDSRREYLVAAILASSTRALKKHDPELAKKSLQRAKEIWEREQNSEPKLYRSVGTPRNLIAESVNASVELYLATSDSKYLDFVLRQKDSIATNMKEVAWSVSRIIDDIEDVAFQEKWMVALGKLSETLQSNFEKNPFGVDLPRQVWGLGWSVLWSSYKHYYLIKKYPELFPPKQLFDALAYINGRHPGSNHSFITGVGSNSLMVAFGINREHYSAIPGGLYSGTAMVLPDFPELKEDHPFLWHQSEYIVFGATPYIFCTLGAQKLVEEGYLD